VLNVKKLGEMSMSKPFNLLYVVSTLASSGPTNQLYNLICNLNQSVFKPIILTLSTEPANSKYQDFVKQGIQVESLSLSRVNMIFQGKKQLKQIIKKIKPDIIHTCGIRPDIYINKYLGEYLHCNTIRNYPYEDYPVKFGKFMGTIMAYTHMKLHKKISYPVSCSYSIADKIKTRHNITTHVIQNGINSEHYSPVSIEEKTRLRKQLNLPEKILFIFVGSLIERKEPILLIKAFKESKLSENATLVILGDGPLSDGCNQLKDDSIIMKGNVVNVSEYLKACDVFVSPSNSEGLPNAVLEAMGASLPSILSDIEPHKEILQRSTDIGVLFKVGNIDGLSECLKKAMDWDFKIMGKRSRNSLEQNFSAKKMSRSYQDFYKTILKSTI
jgi:glycosyltransferase involved in cell wall biosynthesis